MRATFISCVLLAALLGPVAAMAQGLPGDPRQGRALSLSVCADCHSIDKGAPDAEPGSAPSFQAIADNPTMTPLALRVFFATPHADMPDLILTRRETDDVIAYIVSLRN